MRLIDLDADELSSKLKSYLDNDPDFKLVYEHTKQTLSEREDLTAHNWEHSYRDVLNAIVIGEAEGADMRIVLPATIMHDIGFLYGATGKTHGEIGANRCYEFLSAVEGLTYTDMEFAHIAECIRLHKGSAHGLSGNTIEAQVVADADLMEKFGPLGVYQNLRSMTEFNRDFEGSTERYKTIDNLVMQTETGKKLAESGREFVRSFFAELREAAEPYGEMK